MSDVLREIVGDALYKTIIHDPDYAFVGDDVLIGLLPDNAQPGGAISYQYLNSDQRQTTRSVTIKTYVTDDEIDGVYIAGFPELDTVLIAPYQRRAFTPAENAFIAGQESQ